MNLDLPRKWKKTYLKSLPMSAGSNQSYAYETVGHNLRCFVMSKSIKWVKGIGAFSLGMFIGVVYGSIVSTITSFVVLTSM